MTVRTTRTTDFTPEQTERLLSEKVGYMEVAGDDYGEGTFFCGNCRWFKGGGCAHPAVRAPVDRQFGCCNLFFPDERFNSVLFPFDAKPKM